MNSFIYLLLSPLEMHTGTKWQQLCRQNQISETSLDYSCDLATTYEKITTGAHLKIYRLEFCLSDAKEYILIDKKYLYEADNLKLNT